MKLHPEAATIKSASNQTSQSASPPEGSGTEQASSFMVVGWLSTMVINHGYQLYMVDNALYLISTMNCRYFSIPYQLLVMFKQQLLVIFVDQLDDHETMMPGASGRLM